MTGRLPQLPALPPPGRAALLLDMDGTLLDIAPTPDRVVVGPGLLATLRRLRERTGGALAVITGRPIAEVDALLPDAPYAVAGEHGGALRRAPGGRVEHPELPVPAAAWLVAAEALVRQHSGTILEHKRRGFVVHYRANPTAGPALHAALAALVPPSDARFELMPASMAWEVRPRGVDKGRAVWRVMQAPPFAGRLPVFVGDDVTDRDGIAEALAMGGVGLLVPDVFGDAAGVRAWLHTLGREGAWPGW
ncbi:MAG TPA: trehalose-phosphatase [Acetobacteraceae bacterium]|nr:trehalose-phosphatase [Acetobacteraceae bacterium]